MIEYDVENLLNQLVSIPNNKVYLVGGYVRDSLLGIRSNDYDIVISCSIDEVIYRLKLLNYTVIDTSREFGTVAVMLNDRKIDIAEFRGDIYDGVTRKPNIHRVKTIEEDLRRRDFSINAMAMEYPSMKIIDPFKGRHALFNHYLITIRDPTTVFNDDPLRMLRAVRFAAKYNLEIDSSIMNAISTYRYQLDRISGERIREELFKGFGGDYSQTHQYAVNLLNTNLFEVVFPEYKGSIAIQHDHRGHHYGETLPQHSLDALDRYTGNDVLMRITVFLHDIGKTQTRSFEGGKIRFIDHDMVGALLVQNTLRRLKFTNNDIGFVSRMIKHHLDFANLEASHHVRNKLATMFIEQNEDIRFFENLAILGSADQQKNYLPYIQTMRGFIDYPRIMDGNDVLFLPPELRSNGLKKARYYQLINQGETKQQLLHLIMTDWKENKL